MTIAIETYLVVALAFAVFSAITALGSSLVLGIGFERLRAGFEIIKSQTAYFSDSIHGLDKRVDAVEKQGSFFFESLHKLEEQSKNAVPDGKQTEAPVQDNVDMLLQIEKPANEQPTSMIQLLWDHDDSEKSVRFN